jgi:hypothetical protein
MKSQVTEYNQSEIGAMQGCHTPSSSVKNNQCSQHFITGSGRMISWFWNVNKKGKIDPIENFISL